MKKEISGEPGLEYYYAGDDSWYRMVEMAKEDFWVNSPYQLELLNAVDNNLDLAMVIYAKKRNNSLEWIKKKVPALDKVTPIECIQNPELINRLREGLMRMPFF